MLIKKPWGYEDIWASGPYYIGKILFIEKDKRLSLQYHIVKKETIRVLDGVLELEMGSDTLQLKEGESCFIDSEVIHRMKGITDCHILEVSTPHMQDVVRLEDDHGRIVQG